MIAIEYGKKYYSVEKAMGVKIRHGFTNDGTVYAYEPTLDEFLNRVGITRESSKKGGRQKLRLYQPTKAAQQALILSGRAMVVCTAEYLAEIRTAYGYINDGQAFEAVITLQNGGEPHKKGDRADTKGFWEGGDVVINGVEYQIKYSNCSISNCDNIDEQYARIIGE